MPFRAPPGRLRPEPSRPPARGNALSNARTRPAPRAAGRPFAFAGAEFWRLWYAGLAVFTVRWGENLACAVFVYQRTHSPFLVSMMTMLRLLPMGLFGAFLGAWAERFERRAALIAMILAMAATSAVLAALAFAGRLEIWELAVASFINGIGWAADNPVRRVAMGEIVGSEHMGPAMSIDVMANNGSRMLGPAIGGALLASGGIGAVFTLSVILYATALAATLLVRTRNAHAPAAGGSVLAGIAEGLAFVRRDPRLRGVLTVTVIYNIFAWPFTSMVPVIAETNLHLGSAGTGVLASMDGVGAFIGASLLAALVTRRYFAAAYMGGVMSYSVLLIVFALLPDPWLAGGALIATGLGGAGFSVMQATLVYLFAPPEMRSRLLGVLSVCIGVGPVGFLIIGTTANAIGARGATIATGLEALAALALASPWWRRIGRAGDGG
ncbi:MAG: MFS transporter [Rhodospirillales bacterium]|nr:MFS transporter [Rhodospirillales bacterium]